MDARKPACRPRPDDRFRHDLDGKPSDSLSGGVFDRVCAAAAASWIAPILLAVAMAATRMAPCTPEQALPPGRCGIRGCAAMLALLSAAASIAATAALRHLVGRIRPTAHGAGPSGFDLPVFDDCLAAVLSGAP